METSVQRSSKIPSISDSYKRITGGTPIISVGNPGASYKSQTESALEKYRAEKSVEDERFKDQYIKQYGKVGYETYLEAMKTREEQLKAKQDLYKKMGPPSDYQRGFAQAQENKRASESAAALSQGYAAGSQGGPRY
jgi:exonuclease VII large subunit